MWSSNGIVTVIKKNQQNTFWNHVKGAKDMVNQDYIMVSLPFKWVFKCIHKEKKNPSLFDI